MTDEGRDERSMEEVGKPEGADGREMERILDAVGWGLFFIWVGIAFLATLPLGVGLLGVGVITLAMQVARKYLKVKMQGFWLVVGAVFVLAGLWELYQQKLPLVPIVLIIVGLTLVVSAVRGKGAPKA